MCSPQQAVIPVTPLAREEVKLQSHRLLLLLLGVCFAASGQNPHPVADGPDTPKTVPVEVRTIFRVRYISGNSVYLEGGRSAGLTDGMRLVVHGQPITKAPAAPTSDSSMSSTAGEETTTLATIAELKVVAVAETSAVCEVITSTRSLAAGDVATLPPEEVEKLVEKRTLGGTAKLSGGRQFHRRRSAGRRRTRCHTSASASRSEPGTGPHRV